MSGAKVSVLAEVEWDFDGDDSEWEWLDENATFSHREACEFIVHIGDPTPDDPGQPTYAQNKAKEMREAGLREDFVKAYEDAAASGATRILFWS